MPLRILLVEGHADTRQWLGLFLEAIGHTVSAQRTLEDALSDIANFALDVLISALHLPDGTAWDLLERARLPSNVYAIAYGGTGVGAELARSSAAGFRRHLVKPRGLLRLESVLSQAANELRVNDLIRITTEVPLAPTRDVMDPGTPQSQDVTAKVIPRYRPTSRMDAAQYAHYRRW
jgi:CheY-like chemotaxis protein